MTDSVHDITDAWKELLPDWYKQKHPNVTEPTTVPSETPSGSPSETPSETPRETHHPLSAGMIAGISIGVIVVAVFLALIGYKLRSNAQKLKRRTKELAEANDAKHPDGVTQRQNQLLFGPPSHESLNPAAPANSPIQNPYIQYSHPTNEEHYPPSPPLFGLRDQAIPEITPAPQQTYQAYPYERGVARHPSQRSARRTSHESLGTTAVASSHMQRYSYEPGPSLDAGRPKAPVYDEHGQKVLYR